MIVIDNYDFINERAMIGNTYFFVHPKANTLILTLPSRCKVSAHEQTVAPVVTMSSMSRTCFPTMRVLLMSSKAFSTFSTRSKRFL